MKTLLNRLGSRRAFGSGVPITTSMLLLASLAAGADTPYTATGWVTGVPVMPIVCTNAAGQVLLRGNVQTARVVANDTRLTGNRLIFANGGYQADGTALIYGTAYQQVGTFDPNTNFIPTAGVWEITYNGVMQADNSLQLALVGYGSGGTIDGMRIQESMTRGPATAPVDPTVPLLYTGTLKPAPVNTITVIGNFEGPLPPSWVRYGGSFSQTNGQLTIRESWPGIHTVTMKETAAVLSPERAWAVTQGQSVEARVDLVSLNGAAPGAALAIYQGPGVGYGMVKGTNYILVAKQNGAFTFLSADKLTTKNTNEVLTFALTPSGPNVILTARVLDKSNGEAVLYATNIVDTPASDPSLNSAQLAAITGMTLQTQGDPSGAPWTSGTSPWLGLFQYNPNGTLPAAEATFDNFEQRTYDIPPLSIQRAVQLTWPAPAGVNWAVEGAPTVQGPWLPVLDPVIPGIQKLTVPLSSPAQFFRLQQAP